MRPSPPPLLIYLHGFNSSPASHKARLLLKHVTKAGQLQHYQIPQLDHVPDRAMQELTRLLNAMVNNANITLLGSSLGGYYASFLVERFGVNAVLVNPAVNPVCTLARYVGHNRNYYTGEEYQFAQAHLQQLARYRVDQLTRPERYRVFLQRGDATLDYREAEARYRHCDLHIEAGGSHGYSGFERIIPSILAFAGLSGGNAQRSTSVS